MEPDPEKKKEWDEVLRYIDGKNVYKDSWMCYRDSKLYEKLLRYVTNDKTLEIHQCTLNDNHDGMYSPTASIVHRYKLHGIYESSEYEGDIIVKLRYDETDRSKFRMGLLHENEMIAYNKIIPILEKFCQGQFPSPLIFYARRNAFIMEFLGNRQYYPIHRTVQGLRHEYCEPVLKSLAKFHSTSLVCKFRDPLKFREIKKLPREVLFYYKQANIVDYMEIYLDKLQEVFQKQPWSDEFHGIFQTLTNLRCSFVKQIKQLVFNPSEFDVFCHGDLRVCNVLIKDNLQDARFIDFQQICHSSVARDLVTLFYVNLQPNELWNCTKYYLKNYWNHLHAFLKQEEIYYESILTEEWLDREMKRYQVYGIVYGLWHIAEFYIDNRREKKTLHNLSKYKCEKLDLGTECYERSKSLLLYYIEQVPFHEQIVVTDEELVATEEELPTTDEEVVATDKEIGATNEDAVVAYEETDDDESEAIDEEGEA